MYDLRTLDNPLLRANLIRRLEKLNPDLDISSLIDNTLTPREARDEIKRKYPYVLIEKPPENGFLSVNSFCPADLRYSAYECRYCHLPFEAERSTKKYCSDSHRVMDCRKRKKDKVLASGN